MDSFLFDVHQSQDSLWRWHGCHIDERELLVVSRRYWQSRPEAYLALTRFLEAVGLHKRC
jgi:hypothetical protein